MCNYEDLDLKEKVIFDIIDNIISDLRKPSILRVLIILLNKYGFRKW